MHPADSYMSQSKNVWGHGYSDQDVEKVAVLNQEAIRLLTLTLSSLTLSSLTLIGCPHS